MVDVVSITALVISVVALVTTILQLLQQYFGSAEGYRRCAKSVMGKWSDGTYRRFRRSELRFEVIFETPVIFMAPSTNDKGPIPKKPIHYIDGTRESYDKTGTMDRKKETEETMDHLRSVHTADDERASWLTILSSLQLMEAESRSWEETNGKTPRGLCYAKPVYSMSVGLQRKTRSWDFMPAAVYKPFATTTICHLVEMVTMLGMFWKTFDQKTWHMRAEGNGFILTSNHVPGLGEMVTFSITGVSTFRERRVIPSEVIKELSFGSVPSIFEKKPALKHLTFGTDDEVIGTLELLGCTTDATGKYRKKHKHIFPVAFDIIGMLALPVRIRGSNFKMLPNPTLDHFPSNNFSRCKLMSSFQAKLEGLISDLSRTANSTPNSTPDTDSEMTSNERLFGENMSNNTLQLLRIVEHWHKMQLYWPKGFDEDVNLDETIDIDLREAIHDALDESSQYLLTKPDLVCSVVSAHTDFVLDNLNSVDTSPLQGLSGRRSGEDKLLSIYFADIRRKVVEGVGDNRESIEIEDGDMSAKGDTSAKRNTIWCTLVFRMICWLLLHDFDKADVKITPSDLKGSRMPVYIG